MKNKNRQSKGLRSGFTLIELLIVITIIGILAAALLPSVLNAPARARDAARKADLSHIVQALETYNSDKGSYPTGSGCIETIGGNGGADLAAYFQGGRVPNDPGKKGISGCANPNGTAGISGYFYCSLPGDGQQSYLLASYMESVDNANTDDTGVTGITCSDPNVADPGATLPAKATAPYAYVVIE